MSLFFPSHIFHYETFSLLEGSFKQWKETWTKLSSPPPKKKEHLFDKWDFGEWLIVSQFFFKWLIGTLVFLSGSFGWFNWGLKSIISTLLSGKGIRNNQCRRPRWKASLKDWDTYPKYLVSNTIPLSHKEIEMESAFFFAPCKSWILL